MVGVRGAPEGGAETGVGGDRGQVAGVLAARPVRQVEGGGVRPGAVHGRVGDRDVQREQQVEQVQVLDADPQDALAVGAGREVGAQPSGGPLHQVEEGRRGGAAAPAPVPGGVEALQPAGRAVGAALLRRDVRAGQSGVRSGLREDPQPQVGEPGVVGGRHQFQERAPYGRDAAGQGDEGGPVRLPPAVGGPQGGGQREEFGEVVLLRLGGGQACGAGQAAQFRGGLGGGGEAAGGPAHAPAPEALVRLGGREPGGELLAVSGEDLHRQRADQGEFEEDGVEPVLVDGQAVLGLAGAGAGEELSRVRGVLDAEEDPGGLLVEDGQEVRDRGGEPLGEFEAGVQGGLGLGPGLPGEAVELRYDREGVVAVLGVVDQDPFGEAQLLAAAEADDGRFPVGFEAEEAGGEVLGGAEFGRGEADDDPVLVENGVAVGPGGQFDRRGPRSLGAGREHGPGREQLRVVAGPAGSGVHGPVGSGRAGHASPPSSIVRPA